MIYIFKESLSGYLGGGRGGDGVKKKQKTKNIVFPYSGIRVLSG